MRKVDKLGRIVIPMKLRKKYGLFEGADIEFRDLGDGILVKSLISQCKIYKSRLSDDADFPLCDRCTKKQMDEFIEPNALHKDSEHG